MINYSHKHTSLNQRHIKSYIYINMIYEHMHDFLKSYIF